MLSCVAVLSDVHGVLPVLQAVLDEPDVVAADLIVVTGDLAAGPLPVETLDLLMGLGDRVRCLKGNSDRELVEHRQGKAGTIPDPIVPWAAEQLRDEHLEFLDALPTSV